jgi:hypothetical protein
MNIREKKDGGEINKKVYRIKVMIRQSLNGLSVNQLSFNNLFIVLEIRSYVFRAL